jgi:hypothetical protein
MDKPYYVNVSSVQDFMVCRFRWWVKWVMNRDSIYGAPALDAGKLLHRIFERHFKGESLVEASDAECEAFRLLIPSAHPASQNNAMKALMQIIDLREAWPLWTDRFSDAETLEVEGGFEYQDPELPWLIWRGRPDRVIVYTGRIWHMQNRGLAASTNFGTYCRLALRHYHEHLYGKHLAKRYGSKKRKYGGTIFNLVRKLKFRTNVGQSNEKTKTAAEMFYQQAVSYEMGSPLHASVMDSMRQHVVAMRETERLWREENVIPAPNEKMNGGFGGNSEDVFFKLLIGEIKLSDNTFFKEREDTYANSEATNE